jgi:replicative DNA helicase
VSARRKLQAVPPQDAPPVGDERTLPRNLDAEKSVLGAILVHNDAFEGAARLLKPADFYRDAHARIFQAMSTLIDDRRVVVDFITLREELSRRGDLNEVGGPAYVSSLASGVPRSTNIAYYAGIVKEKAILRAIIATANRVLTDAYAAEESAPELLRKADRAFLELTSATPGRLEAVKDSMNGLFADIEHRIEHRGELRGCETGFASINGETMGWMPGELIVVGARPSVGKTTFVMNSAVAACRAGKKVAVFSLEMRKRQLHYRMLSNLSGVSLSRLMNGVVGGTEYSKVSDALGIMHDLELFIDDRSGQSFWDVRSTTRRLKAERGLDLVIIDYVQLMSGSLDRHGANRNEEIADISRRLKIMADELNLPVILCSQLSRAGAKRNDPTPQLSDLRESGALEQDADTVALLHRKNYREGGLTYFILAKQRNGPTGTVNLTFEKDISTFLDGGEEPPRPSKKGAEEPRDPRLPVDGD